MHTSRTLLATLGFIGALAPSASFAAKVEEQVVGPLVEQQGSMAPYSPSMRGSHLATIARKGSRVVVTMDGVDGPRFDSILEPTWVYVDPRPYQQIDTNYQPQKSPVVFSRDGKRFAYVARQSQEWVVMVDNKESLRIPAKEGTYDVRMEFTGDDAKHFVFMRHSGYEGFEMWVDGQKWPGFYSSGGGGSDGTIDPLISPDGSHIAAVAQIARDKQALIVDGKDAGYMAVNLHFTADSKHLIGIFRGPKGGETLMIDGKPIGTAVGIPMIFIGPVGSRMIAAISHQNPDKSPGGFVLLVDGKIVPATLTPTPSDFLNAVIFSPDGKHWAAICGKPNTKYVVVDGKKGQEYQSIAANQPMVKMTPQFAFSPDGSKLAYVATAAGKQFVVVGEDESDAFEMFGNISIYFSADGKRMAYFGATSGANARLIIDGKVAAKAERGFSQFAFGGPDGAHYAYEASQDPNGTMLDGQPTGVVSASGVDLYDYIFSPDGQHLAMFGMRAKDQKGGMFVDKEHITASTGCRFCAFTPDSQHVYWLVSEPVGSGKQQWVVYLDGKPAAKFDAYGIFDRAWGFVRAGKIKRLLPGFDVRPDGTLTCLGAVGDEIKRFTITPTAETNITTMIAEAKAAAAKPPGKKT